MSTAFQLGVGAHDPLPPSCWNVDSFDLVGETTAAVSSSMPPDGQVIDVPFVAEHY